MENQEGTVKVHCKHLLQQRIMTSVHYAVFEQNDGCSLADGVLKLGYSSVIRAGRIELFTA